jgi:hypothetical protein
MAWPTTLAVAVAAAASVAAGELLATAPMAAAWAGPILLVLYGAVVATPVYSAGRIATVHALRYERSLIWTFLAIIGEAYAIGLAFVVFLIADRVWP